MKILIINGFPRTHKGLQIFDDFHWAIKKILSEQKEFIDIETEYVTREKDNIDDFLYEPDSGYAKLESSKLFDHLDMIFICGDPYLFPWHSTAKKIVLLIRMCIRVNKIIFLSSFGFYALVFLCATNFEKSINVINGDGKGGKLGDLTSISKDFSKITTDDFFLDNVTGDLYSYSFDKNEWSAKANIGIHYEKAAQEFYTLGKFIVKSPTYRVKSLNSLANLFISKNTESICYLKKSHLSHYLFQQVPFEFLISNKGSWVLHTFSFINNKKNFNILAETKKGPCLLELKNCIVVECEISEKYPCTIQILRNFILHHLKFIKAFNRNSEYRISNCYYKTYDPLQEKEINEKKKIFFEKRRKIDFDVFLEENSTRNYEEITRFHHCGYSATKQLPIFIEKNTILDNKFGAKTKRFKNIYSSLDIKDNHAKEIQFIKTEENFNKNQDLFEKNLTKSKIRMILHPNLSDNCLKENKLWVPGNLSKHSFKNDTDSEISKKGSTMLSGFGDKNKTLNSFYNHKFREEKKLNWIGENFKFGSKN